MIRQRWTALTGGVFRLGDARERQLADERFAENLHVVRLSILLGVILYGVFGAVDLLLLDADLTAMWVMRYAVVCPYLLAVFALTFTPVFRRLQDLLVSVAGLLAGFGILSMMAWMTSDPGDVYYVGLVVIPFYLFSFLRLRLLHATVVTWLLFLGYQVVALWIDPVSLGTFIVNDFFLVTGAIVAMATGFFHELTFRRSFLSRRQTEDRERQLRSISGNIPGFVFRLAETGRGTVIDYVSDGVRELLGVSPEDLRRPADLLRRLDRDDRRKWIAVLRRQPAEDRRTWAHEARARVLAGTPRWIGVTARRDVGPDGRPVWDGVVLDATARHQAEQRAEFYASYDALTGLPNRDLAASRLAALIAAARREDARIAVAIVNIRRFNLMNQSVGLEAADEILRIVARRLEERLEGSEVVARMTGDHFLVAFGFRNDPAQALVRLKELIDALSERISLKGLPITLSAGAGISVFPDDGSDPQALIAAADSALSELRRDRDAVFRFFQSGMNRQAQSFLSLETELREALLAGQVLPFYQPQVSLRSGRIIGAEALARWTHAMRGPIGPEQFIPVAEETGLISRLSDSMLAQACADRSSWHDAGREFTVSVNLSGKQRLDDELAATVRRQVKAADIRPDCLELEITEGQLIGDSKPVRAFFEELSALGVRFALDDFGTGYSSLSSLSRYPLSKVKIDQSFLRTKSGGRAELRLLRSVIGVASSLGLTSVAEGVETVEEATLLRTLGCDAVQGFFVAPALDASAFASLLARDPLLGVA